MTRPPYAVQTGAGKRLRETLVEQAFTENALRSRRPLDAEEDEGRKLAYIQRILGIGPDIARRVAAYEPPEQLPLTPGQKAGAESLQGATVDFLPVGFLDRGRAASRSVARVVSLEGDPVGTGFMVSPRLFLTNQHVIENAEAARALAVEFNYEAEGAAQPAGSTTFLLDPGRFFVSDGRDDLDFALVAVGEKREGKAALDDFGFLPLIDSRDKHAQGMPANIIQHPMGRPKELVIRENRLFGATQTTLLYGADTLPGSSGSPVFNDQWEVIAIHHWGEPHLAFQNTALDIPPACNEGVRITAILDDLRKEKLPALPTAQAELLGAALAPGFRRPSLCRRGGGEATPPAPAGPPPPPAAPGPRAAGDGPATWVLPLEVSVRLGEASKPGQPAPAAPPPPAPPPPAPSPAGAEGFKPDLSFSGRRGYNPRFLGARVDLPALSRAQKEAAAENREAKRGDDPFELKYHHFSIVMNGERRLPFFTAVNIDGASVVKVDRKSCEVRAVEGCGPEGAEGGERWFDDDRILESQRCVRATFSQPEFSIFQRGHLVKRTDPSWGTPEAALQAQADTFFFTNCTPQHKEFNPIKSRWAGVEDWITNESDDQDLRVSVFSGPVLAEDDPVIGGLKIPRKYWKIVARVEEGRLLATAVLADQGDLLPTGEGAEGAEGMPPLPEKLPADYQTTVAEIERLTGLDFGPLRKRDTFEGGEGAEPKRKIARFAEIQTRRAAFPKKAGRQKGAGE